ncbi:hypothetical protein CDD81_6358 [Ophiocordyceps australis]|uniref:endo-1,3(4)-beta-glucanase n=1 Tax=Ophiocordyceps australis TaxID=1399860 RepID=A0A2C5Y2W5_9HYPO|nr:hypothetical protein CDD81_6358 [Ophiocordyceps australis]
MHLTLGGVAALGAASLAVSEAVGIAAPNMTLALNQTGLLNLTLTLNYTMPFNRTWYKLDTTYDSLNFFDDFEFFTDKDPTHGYVDYVDRSTAQEAGLIGHGQRNDSIIMSVDDKTVKPANGRMSVRVTSKKTFTRGLFIADIAHMPASACGVWPAFWMFGPSWPTSGEIDIIEGVSRQQQTKISLHTAQGCSISNAGSLATTMLEEANCEAGPASGGCGQQTADSRNYGDGFNAVKGGVYATEWTPDHIAVWFFPRAEIPGDVINGRPDPKSWGMPTARFAGGYGCDIDSHFSNHSIVFDTTFCGDWAGLPQVWASDEYCASQAPTCNSYVANNPTAFRESFWEVNSIKVYQLQKPMQRNQTRLPTSPYGVRGPWRA